MYMADELNINVNAKLDPDASAVQINNGLDELYKSGKINPVNVSVKLDTDAIKSQTSQVQTQINNIAKANSSGFKVPIDFNVSTDKIKEQLTTIVNQIRGGAKGQVIDFKANLDDNGLLSDKSNILIKYRNDANQVTESILKLKDTKEKLDDGTADLKWTETLKSVSQNIEQTTKKAEQLTEVQQRLNQQLQAFKTTVNSFGDKNISSLLDNNQLGTKYQSILNGLNSVSDSNGLTQVKNQFKELQTQTSQYANEQKVLQDETKTSYNTQIQDLETLTKSEARRAQAIQETSDKVALLAQQTQLLESKASNAGVSLNQTKLSGLTDSLNNGNVEKATQYYKELRIEYQQLNAEMSKKLPQNAIDNMQERAKSLSTQIDQITAKFSTLNTTGDSNFTKNFSTQIEQANTSIKELQKNLNTFNTAKTGQEQVSAFNQLNNSVKESKTQVNDLVKAYQTLNRIEASAGSFEKYLQQNPQVLQKHSEEVKSLQNQYKQLFQETDITKLQTGFKETTTNVSAFKGNIRSLGEEGRTVLGELGNDLKKQLQWLTSGSLLFGTIATIKKMADNVKDLNTSMTNIQMASGLDNNQVANLMNTYNQMGQTLGATTKEVATSADGFIRQGKSIADTNTLIKDSMVLSKIGEIDSTSATDYLTASMKGYGVATKDTMSIVDKLSAVDMQSATSAGGLAEGMSRVANMANLSGVSMDKLIGYLATVGETTQKEMSEVGNSFQTIFSRMGNVKAGKFIDDKTGENLNDVESVLKKLGINLRDSQGQFRNFGTVLDDTASKWKSYDSVQKNAITTAMAGVRNRENLLVLLNNYSTATKYATTASESSGTAMQKMQSYESSLEAKTKSASAAFEQLSKTIVNGNVFGGLIDTGTGFLNVLNTIVSKLHMLPTLIGAITAALSLTKNVGKMYAYAA